MSRPALGRAKADIREGRLWKARDRLQGLYATYPADQELLGVLGEVCATMGDWPEAGRWWFLTARTGPEVEQAESAWQERCGKRPVHMIQALKVRANIDDFPPTVRERLRRLQSLAAAEGYRWTPSANPADRAPARSPESTAKWPWPCIALAALGAGIVIVGIGTILVWLARLVGL